MKKHLIALLTLILLNNLTFATTIVNVYYPDNCQLINASRYSKYRSCPSVQIFCKEGKQYKTFETNPFCIAKPFEKDLSTEIRYIPSAVRGKIYAKEVKSK